MSNIIIVVGSQSSATRLARRLNSYGKNAKVISTPANLRTGEGCSTSVRTDLSSESIVKNNIRGITIKGIYIEEIIGEEHYYYDIFR